MTALTDETLERAGYKKVQETMAAFREWWKPLYAGPVRTGLEYSQRISVRFNESPNSVRVYVAGYRSCWPARGVETLEDLEELRRLMDGLDYDKFQNWAYFQYAGKLGPWARGGMRGKRYLDVSLAGKPADYREILATAKVGATWYYIQVDLEDMEKNKPVWCGTNVYVGA